MVKCMKSRASRVAGYRRCGTRLEEGEAEDVDDGDHQRREDDAEYPPTEWGEAEESYTRSDDELPQWGVRLLSGWLLAVEVLLGGTDEELLVEHRLRSVRGGVLEEHLLVNEMVTIGVSRVCRIRCS